MPTIFPAIAAAIVLMVFPAPCRAGETTVAVAANFTDPAKDIAAEFQKKTGHVALLSFGASGQFYTQIVQGAPFQILLSADTERPGKLIADGIGLGGSRFTYAIGKLVLWSKTSGLVSGASTLRLGGFTKLAIANPAAAPYGTAAIETLKSLMVYDTLQPKIVLGNSIGQAFQFIDTGNAELGFVALSQLTVEVSGSRWVVPQELYTPIRQDAILLKKGADNPAALAFLDFLKAPEAKLVIQKYGYALAGAD